ncbi:MAG: hypothetical protein K940chlam6_00071 [Chlamydiae bacterium]|nr:hypothetical protein [Chlamydiota bacterium]
MDENITREPIVGKIEEGLPEFVKQEYGMMDDMLEMMIDNRVEKMNMPVDPPKDEKEFHGRLVRLFESGFNEVFGLQQYFEENKSIRGEVTIESYIEIKKKIRKKEIGGDSTLVKKEVLSPYQFLKLSLERDFPFTQQEQYYLGIFPDLGGISRPDRKVIGIQAAGQVLWYENRKTPLCISDIPKYINSNEKLVDFLDLYNFKPNKKPPNTRVLRNQLREVYPLPRNMRRKYQKPTVDMSGTYFSKIISIPRIFIKRDPLRINYLKLRVAIMAITRTLSILGKSRAEVFSSPIILHYRTPLRFYCKDFIGDWVEESLDFNGNIFDL